MKRLTIAVLLVFVVALSGLLAQEMPKPGPEHKRLGYFIGTWNVEADMKPSPFGPAGKFTATDRVEWLAGGFFAVLHSEMTTPMGPMFGLAVFSYNAEEKVYRYHAFNSMGMFEDSRGTVSGGTWNWTSEGKVGAKLIKSRFTLKEVSPTSYTYYWATEDGNKWTTIMEGKATKAKGSMGK
ncbi:MAG: DUF1579 family protein [Acidobacteriota bacterium]